MKVILYRGFRVINATKNALKFCGSGLFVLILICGYTTFTFSGALYDFLNSYSKISSNDLVITFYAPLFAICTVYLSVLSRRAACLYFAPNLKQTISTKTTVEILLMVCIILMCACELIAHAPMASGQRIDALTILVSLTVAGCGFLIRNIKKPAPFTQDTIEINFSDWFPKQKYNCVLPINKYKMIVGLISQSCYFIACVIFTAALILHK